MKHAATSEYRCLVLHSLPTQEKIDKAKSAIEAWIKELEAAKA